MLHFVAIWLELWAHFKVTVVKSWPWKGSTPSDAQTTLGRHCTAALQVNCNTMLASTDSSLDALEASKGCRIGTCALPTCTHTQKQTHTKTKQKEDKISHPLQWKRGKRLSWFHCKNDQLISKKDREKDLETGNTNAPWTHIQNRLCRSSVQNVWKKHCSKDTSWPKKHWNSC